MLIKYLQNILDINGCLVLKDENRYTYFFEDYTYKSELEKITIKDSDGAFVISDIINICTPKRNSLQIGTSKGIIELNIL